MILTNRFSEVITQIKMSGEINGMPIYWVSAFLVDDLLVDTGCDHTKNELGEVLAKIKVRKIANTHHHEDHIGCNHMLQVAKGIPIYAHPLAVPLLHVKPKLDPYQEFAWGRPEPSVASSIGDSIETENHEFEVVCVPGHSKDHVALVEKKERWVFAGDAFVTVKPVGARLEEDQWEVISSLKKIREFNPQVMFPGVNDPILDASGTLDRTISIRERMGNKIVQLEREGLTPDQILKEVFLKEASYDRMGMKGTYKEFTQGHFSTLNLVLTFLKHEDDKPN
jgi:glyoxylase-like metal-dependent hydrolase (beta-lactamase superfamily II)